MATQDIYDAVIHYNLRGIADLVQAELDSGTDIAVLLKQ
ncbi:MAG TPA: cobalamin-binding protein, partial [Desulfobacteraceae bacterium]|nr:cobalamin-binding protein [Desulfobacteraceae bacterium]